MNKNKMLNVVLYGDIAVETARHLLESTLCCLIQSQCSRDDVLQFQVNSSQSAIELNHAWLRQTESEKVDVVFSDPCHIPQLNQKGCLFMDMDSTLITCECIDEIADFMGIKETIANITLRAMQGELDFSQSLRARVKLLAGLDAQVLAQVYQQRIHFTDGAETLIQTLQQYGWNIALVSGGFTYFTDQLHQRLKLDYSQANVLEVKHGKLTGQVVGDIVDAQSKRKALLKQAKLWGIPATQTVAIGDGANDLPMLNTAAMGVAFHAKMTVRQQADYSIRHTGLNGLLDLLGHVT